MFELTSPILFFRLLRGIKVTEESHCYQMKHCPCQDSLSIFTVETMFYPCPCCFLIKKKIHVLFVTLWLLFLHPFTLRWLGDFFWRLTQVGVYRSYLTYVLLPPRFDTSMKTQTFLTVPSRFLWTFSRRPHPLCRANIFTAIFSEKFCLSRKKIVCWNNGVALPLMSF